MFHFFIGLLMFGWIINASLSAITFAIGDFLVVKAQLEKLEAVPLFLAYTLIMGLMAVAIMLVNNSYSQEIKALTGSSWKKIVMIACLFLIAYYTHFLALAQAPNPGYANALVMFHVALLSLISYFFLNKPLNRQTVVGIILMFFGSFLVVRYS